MNLQSENWHLKVTPVGPLQMNSILVTADGPHGCEGILIDPGEEASRLLATIAASGCSLKYILASHCHFDHIGAAAVIQQTFDMPLLCHPGDVPLLKQLPDIQAAYGFPRSAVPEFDACLTDQFIIRLAGREIVVRHVPGHSPGQVMFVLPGFSTPVALVGDCLFQGSVGRTDLPGGDFETLATSIRTRIYALPDNTVVISGHGPKTTVGHEKVTNPWVPAAV